MPGYASVGNWDALERNVSVMNVPNNPAAPTLAIAALFHGGCPWRGVGEPHRWADETGENI